jgi:hypothetical protein
MSHKILLLGRDWAHGDMDDQSITFVVLPHPKYGPIEFVRCGIDLYELQTVQPRKFGSWFIDQRVSSDPSLFLATKYDQKFIILPFLEKHGQKFSPLDQIVVMVDGCDCLPLNQVSMWHLDDICDVNDKFGDDMILYRLNQDKTLDWLRKKVQGIAEYIGQQRRLKSSHDQVATTFDSSIQSGRGAFNDSTGQQ